MIIGKKGAEIDKLTKELENLTHRHIEVKTIEVNRPEIDPQLVAEDIAEQLREAGQLPPHDEAGDRPDDGGRGQGREVQLSGRLGGSEMARCETSMHGSIPLSTLRAKVEYGFAEATTAQGNIGIKVWVNNGDYLTKEEPQDLPPPGEGRPRRADARVGLTPNAHPTLMRGDVQCR